MNETKKCSAEAGAENAAHVQKKLRNKRRVQIATLIVILLLLTAATLASIPLVKALRTEEGMEKLKETLESRYSGASAMLIFVLIQALQVVIAVIPPVQIIGGVLFGWFLGCVLSFGGTLLGTLAIFLMVKRFGAPLVDAFVDEKHLKKYKFLQDESKLIKVLVILYLIPGVPKDVISYIVPLTKIRRREFFLYVMPCRLPAILMSTVMGGNAMDGNFKIVIGIVCAAMVMGICGYFFKDSIVDKLGRHRKNKR